MGTVAEKLNQVHFTIHDIIKQGIVGRAWSVLKENTQKQLKLSFNLLY